MITDNGKAILAKYLIGQAPAYASYIAIGCGAKPLASDGVLGDYSAKDNLDFEMFRVPITSRGYVSEDGMDQVVFTAELPTQERYEISEVGVFSAGSNPSATANDSRTLYSFSQAENWKYEASGTISTIPTVTAPLDQDDLTYANVITQTEKVFQTNADNKALLNDVRGPRHERCRFLNNMIMLRGDTSTLTGSNIDPASPHIRLSGTSIDLTKNAPEDEIRLALSVINKNQSGTEVPNDVKIMIEFSSSAGTDYARFETTITNGTDPGEYDLNNNRYVVVSKKIKDLTLSTSYNFSWSNASVVKIYAVALDGTTPSEDFYIALDAIRLENITSINPLYGLTGYSVIRNTGAVPIIKLANTSNLVEFRFAMDVQ